MSQDTLNLIHDRQNRGYTKLGWLDSDRTFSLGGLFDPEPMRFCTLRLIHDDRVLPGSGFGTHSHHDMEILTYALDALEGAIEEHQDRLGMGNRTGTYPREAQMMSAGAGITHREFNFSETNPVYFPQIWMISDPEELGKKR
ncbi:pirin family protein [Coleofasciculus sp. FACHB-712]|uniref:pirin family protein n=2 Tax=Cyanophyceae TaxID=3028117 RepID=UPI001685C40C|nr:MULTISPECIES: pirin family protein [unclassified Coleofasciculus]MBD1896099.1 pirin family protein [Coleofasciculus sp. FACHB-129]MBD1944207.1 pirin family protein [Coleofasciculus sp. FACHB-712]MBD2541727.1 pirin family protein [Coleofasciculus sp. FACHB-SPT36]